MKTLYIECAMGAAGDMLTGALCELLPDEVNAQDSLNSIGVPKVMYTVEKTQKCGITGTHIRVTVDGEEEHSHDAHVHAEEHCHHHSHEEHSHSHEEHSHSHSHSHHHSSMADIEEIISSLNISEKVKADAVNVYKIIAQAESHCHDKPVSEIHFHEAGSMDAVADVTAVCLLMEKLGAEKIICSPVHMGNGHVHCAHGILPVPAPATEYILRGIPAYSGNVQGELCTPTGAALLKYFAQSFGQMPVMATEKTGYGMGTKDFEQANCVRIFLGETDNGGGDIVKLEFNVDDMTGEQLGFAQERLFEVGAVEVFFTAVMMKKNRPGFLVSVLCRNTDKSKILAAVFRHTSTIGIREIPCGRFTLERRIEEVQTPYGVIHKKVSIGYGVEKTKFEYDDLAKIAAKEKLSIDEVAKKISEI